MIEISSISDISRNIKSYQRDGHKVTPHFLINLKSSFIRKNKYGFIIRYKSGYFLWVKKLGNFEIKLELK